MLISRDESFIKLKGLNMENRRREYNRWCNLIRVLIEVLIQLESISHLHAFLAVFLLV